MLLSYYFSILTNPEIMRQLQSLQAQMQMMTGMQIPVRITVLSILSTVRFKLYGGSEHSPSHSAIANLFNKRVGECTASSALHSHHTV